MTQSYIQNRVVVRGAGDVASGVIRRLVRAGFDVIALEKPDPDFVRRHVCFGEAHYTKEVSIDGITAILVHSAEEAISNIDDSRVPLLIDPDARLLPELCPIAVVDARMLKNDTDTYRNMAPIVIGLGPGFTASENCHAAVETIRGDNLGNVIYDGSPQIDTRVPASVGGYDIQRVVRSPADGIFVARTRIGNMVTSGQIIGEVAGFEIKAGIAGIVRGLIHDGLRVSADQKIGDIDPRGIEEICYTISDKADAIGKGVIEAIQTLRKRVTPF